MEKYCEVCGRQGELHHIIYKSQAKYLENVPINFKFLCSDHHRNDRDCPHRSRKKDLEYKRELQAKLKNIFTHDYYTLTEIKEILNISKKETERVINKTQIYKEGYLREDIITRCMGGRRYDD